MRIPSSKALLLPLLFVAGCSSGNSGGGGDMYVQSCSLGCTNGQGGEQVFCSILNTFQNQEISVLFSESVDMSSVNASSFRVVNVDNGTTPVGTFSTDPNNPRRLIFRPDFSFDLNGAPQFGFAADTPYQVTIPGRDQGDSPPFVRSVGGSENRARLQCTILTSLGIVDAVPGPPTADFFVDVVTSYDANGEPLTFDTGVPASGAVNVFRNSPIVMVFNDLMNPATLVNPSTAQGTFIQVSVDADGDLSTEDDKVTVAGSYVISLDIANLETIVTFTPATGYPSAGAGPRLVVVDVLPGAVDLADNPVVPGQGGGLTAFVPEVLEFEPYELVEDFTDQELRDTTRTSAFWANGMLRPGIGGGSGRLGQLVVPSGQSLTLDTDSQAFPLQEFEIDILGNADVDGNFPTQVTVDDGVFEFTSVTVEAGAQLLFTGSLPPRLMARGPLGVGGSGVINVSGSSASAHNSNVPLVRESELTFRGLGGPNGGDGGWGADRWDATGTGLVTNPSMEQNAIANPGAISEGQPGGGVGRVDADPTGGTGGSRYPATFPTSDSFPTGVGGIAFVNLGFCEVHQIGNCGAGGGYAFGTDDVFSMSDIAMASDPPGPNQDPSGTSGASAVAGISSEPPNIDNFGYEIRTLDPNPPGAPGGGLGYPFFLRGGSGGGGGGMHPFATIASPFIACLDGFTTWTIWRDHSGASGGGGGGAIQLVSGTSVNIQGRVDASGGDGGSGVNTGGDNPEENQDYAAPGGGGSGGAILVQGPVVELGGAPGRLDVGGGQGGMNLWLDMPTVPGANDGSTGLVRIEELSSTYADNLAMNLALTPSILPFEADGAGNSLGWVSCAADGWDPPALQPESYTAAVSCWIRPEGNFFALNFAADVPGSSDPDDMGWNMDVFWNGTTAADLIPFRGDNGVLAMSFEEMFGNEINHAPDAGAGISPIAVRFQGAVLLGSPGGLCNLPLSDSSFLAGSLTAWVDHPALLNDPSVAPIPPNMFRFTILFDQGVDPGVVDSVEGVTNLRVSANPD